MGQYFLIVNLDKKEYIHPHRFASGLKLWEICANDMPRVLPFLLRQSSSSGGGDLDDDYSMAGRWAGDRIVCVGDYDDSKLYENAKETYKDISQQVKDQFNRFMGDKSLMLFETEEEKIAFFLVGDKEQ